MLVDEPRLLAPSELHTRLVDDQWYTSLPGMAMRDEPEAITPLEHQLHVDRRRDRNQEQQTVSETAALEQARRLLSFEQRVAATRMEARRRRIDVTSELRLVGLMIRAGKQARHIEGRVMRVERRVFIRYAA